LDTCTLAVFKLKFFAADGQSASLSWYRTPISCPYPGSNYCQTFAVFFCWAPSLTRGLVCNLLVQVMLELTSSVPVGSKSHRILNHILLSHLKLGSLFVASYDSHGYGGGIPSRLHMGFLAVNIPLLLYGLGVDKQEAQTPCVCCAVET
jgi:hypothetical protein